MASATPADQVYVQALMKEAVYLTSEPAAIDKKIEAELNGKSSELAKWMAENPVIQWGGEFLFDTAAGKALEKVFGAIFKLLKIGTGAGLVADVVVDAFTARGRPDRKSAYMDDHPEIASKYLKMKKRLSRIYAELFWYHPPQASRIAPMDRCAREACFRSARP